MSGFEILRQVKVAEFREIDKLLIQRYLKQKIGN